MASVSTSNESNIVKCREFEGYKGKIYDDEKENFVDQIFEMVKSRPADCTLTAEKKTLKAHKVILSAASNYLKEIFDMDEESDAPWMLSLFIPDVKFKDLCAFVHFIYYGQIAGTEEELNGMKKVAKILKLNDPIGEVDFDTSGTIMIRSAAVPVNISFEHSSETTMSSSEIAVHNFVEVTYDEDGVNEVESADEAMPEGRKIRITKRQKRKSMHPCLSETLIKMPRRARPAVFSDPDPVVVKEQCPHCLKTYKAIVVHARECLKNPSRLITVCDVCEKEFKPSRIAYHKSSAHGIFNKTHQIMTD